MKKITNKLKHEVSESGRIKVKELTWMKEVRPAKLAETRDRKDVNLPAKAILKNKVDTIERSGRK